MINKVYHAYICIKSSYTKLILDRFPDRINGRGKGSFKNVPTISTNVLAKWT